MSKRKNLNDVLHGDRAAIRGYSLPRQDEDEWDRYTNGKGSHSNAVVPYRGTLGSFFEHKGSKGGSWERCYKSHPALKLPGTDLVIYGGSCADPAVAADVYIGFDNSMRFTERNWPWKKGAEVLFVVPDMGVPKKPDEYQKLVSWTRKQLEVGLKVHCGCIGGHGRTGMFLAALVSTFGEKDAINYVRQHYCKKAVESASQVSFLSEHFSVKKAAGYKSHSSGTVSSGKAGKRGGAQRIHPLRDRGSIWGEAV